MIDGGICLGILMALCVFAWFNCERWRFSGADLVCDVRIRLLTEQIQDRATLVSQDQVFGREGRAT